MKQPRFLSGATGALSVTTADHRARDTAIGDSGATADLGLSGAALKVGTGAAR